MSSLLVLHCVPHWCNHGVLVEKQIQRPPLLHVSRLFPVDRFLIVVRLRFIDLELLREIADLLLPRRVSAAREDGRAFEPVVPLRPLLDRPAYVPRPLDLRQEPEQRRQRRRKDGERAESEEDVHVLSDDASRIVPVLTAQELEIQRPASIGAVQFEQELEFQEIGDDEFTGEDWRSGRRLG